MIRRRGLLRGAAGVALTLPLLELGGGSAHAEPDGPGDTPPLFIVTWPNGVFEPHIIPAEAGPGYTLPPALDPLAAWKERFALLTGLQKSEAWRGQDVSSDAHVRGHASTLTGGGITPTGVEGPSIDQFVASLQPDGLTPHRAVVASIGSNTHLRNHVSWSGPDAPAPVLRTPGELYRQLLVGLDGAQPLPPEILEGRRSVLDFVHEDARRLRRRVGRADCDRMEQFFTALREAEGKLLSGPVSCEDPGAPADYAAEDMSNDKARLMVDLMVLAMSCGVSNVMTLQLASRGDNRQFSWLDIEEPERGHHSISHDDSPAGQHAYLEIVRDQMAVLAHLLERMDAALYREGTLLEDALVFTAAEHLYKEGGDGHYFRNVPALLAGGAGGRLRGRGEHHDFRNPEQHTEYANVHVTLCALLGLDVPRFGIAGDRVLPGLSSSA